MVSVLKFSHLGIICGFSERGFLGVESPYLTGNLSDGRYLLFYKWIGYHQSTVLAKKK